MKLPIEKRNSPIGVFDSGVGGLTVVKELLKQLPGEDIVYFGDTARYPYGPQSSEIVTRFSLQNARFLMGFGIKMLLVACNTASSVAMSELEQWLAVPVIGVIEPGAKAAVENTKTNHIAVIGTIGTINSFSYQKAVEKFNPEITVIAKACPLFVPLAEEGFFTGPAVDYFVHYYLDDIFRAEIDTLILGCTHYPLLYDAIRSTAGSTIKIIDSAYAVISELQKFLELNDLHAQRDKGSAKFFVSDSPERFAKIGEKFLSRKLDEVTLVSSD
jgi:glutamate racemase